MELHHIKQKADSGSDEPENLIPLCFDCHAEVTLYNNRHPRGRKYSAEELSAHKDQWIKVCQTSAEFLASIPALSDIGPLQGLYNELRFNEIIADRPDANGIGALFEDSQFSRCMNEGIFWLIGDEVLAPLNEAYFAMKHANALIDGRKFSSSEGQYVQRTNQAWARVRLSKPLVMKARKLLDKYLKLDELPPEA